MVIDGVFVRMLPSIKWMHKVGDNLAMADYQGARDAASMVKFAEAAQKAVLLRHRPDGAGPVNIEFGGVRGGRKRITEVFFHRGP